MNKKLKEIEEKCYEKVPMYTNGFEEVFADVFNKEKFAELIIRECANVADNSYDKGRCPVGGFVMQHFGVEE